MSDYVTALLESIDNTTMCGG